MSYRLVCVSFVLVLFAASLFSPLVNAAEPEMVSSDVDEQIEDLLTEGNIPSRH